MITVIYINIYKEIETCKPLNLRFTDGFGLGPGAQVGKSFRSIGHSLS